MAKITPQRPHGFKTETESWNEDTRDLEYVEDKIKKNEVSGENYFSLFSKVLAVSDRSSLCGNNKYIERIRYCEKLMKILSTKSKGGETSASPTSNEEI